MWIKKLVVPCALGGFIVINAVAILGKFLNTSFVKIRKEFIINQQKSEKLSYTV